VSAGCNAGGANSFSVMVCLIYAHLVYSYYGGVAAAVHKLFLCCFHLVILTVFTQEAAFIVVLVCFGI
jgi:hypothetical protein